MMATVMALNGCTLVYSPVHCGMRLELWIAMAEMSCRAPIIGLRFFGSSASIEFWASLVMRGVWFVWTWKDSAENLGKLNLFCGAALASFRYLRGRITTCFVGLMALCSCNACFSLVCWVFVRISGVNMGLRFLFLF